MTSLNTNELDNTRIVMKIIKLYTMGKKHNEDNVLLSIQYFNKCLNIIKTTKIKLSSNLIEIIEKTICKYIQNHILDLIKKPFHSFNCTKKILDINISDIFINITKGDIEFMNNIKINDIDFNIYNENGFTPLHYGVKYGDTVFLFKAFTLGANIDQTSKDGITLIEYACIEDDPNIIEFLISCGAELKKYILFRQGKQFTNYGDNIDMSLIQKYIILEYLNCSTIPHYNIQYLTEILKYFKLNDYIGIEFQQDFINLLPSVLNIKFTKISVYFFIQSIDYILTKLPQESINSYISIITDELSYDLHMDLCCPSNKLDILIYYLLPFIDYTYGLKSRWVLQLEIKFKLIHYLYNINFVSSIDMKDNVITLLEKEYLETHILPTNLMYILAHQWFNKLNI